MIYRLLSKIKIEVWKNIPSFKNYQVSNLGNVRSLNYRKTGKTKVLIKSLNSRGRYSVNLYKNNKMYSGLNISVLVAKAFLNHKPNGGMVVVDHINNIKKNDNLYNLQVITQRENSTKDRKGTSKYVGVYWNKSSSKWQSTIYINGKYKYLGIYKSEQKASQAYQNELKNI
tara:strand:- start:549 stop:1061 length:513 start_codon:yes stop_codon:yes gene_type:complete